MFPSGMKVSHVPHLVILGAPIRNYLFCACYIASKRSEAMKLLLRLVEVACFDPQVALILLQMCGCYCKMVHLARATPPSLASVPVYDLARQQAQLNLSHDSMGLRSVSHHSSAVYIASLCSSGFGNLNEIIGSLVRHRGERCYVYISSEQLTG